VQAYAFSKIEIRFCLLNTRLVCERSPVQKALKGSRHAEQAILKQVEMMPLPKINDRNRILGHSCVYQGRKGISF
jgi:hypothetical protein